MLVNDIYTSIQGEGIWAGEPAVFLRLHGCPLKCFFCDAPSSWSDDGGREMSLQEIVHALQEHIDVHKRIKRLVITGGEPLHGLNGYQLVFLLNHLATNFARDTFIPMVETSGCTLPEGFFDAVKRCPLLTVSPAYERADSPTFLPVVGRLVARAAVFKFLVDGSRYAMERVENFMGMMRVRSSPLATYVQPVDFGKGHEEENERAMAQAVGLALEHGWTVSVQTRKVLGVP